ncbi:MAG: hypothetical protein JOS17DRAFT_56136 [Linnemannia elongata]|nr:MAG: hypothetical protein JOS17DRAFT_56136 [Linnemannia elongata]
MARVCTGCVCKSDGCEKSDGGPGPVRAIVGREEQESEGFICKKCCEGYVCARFPFVFRLCFLPVVFFSFSLFDRKQKTKITTTDPLNIFILLFSPFPSTLCSLSLSLPLPPLPPLSLSLSLSFSLTHTHLFLLSLSLSFSSFSLYLLLSFLLLFPPSHLAHPAFPSSSLLNHPLS